MREPLRTRQAIEPQIDCTVSYLELTAAGMLRAPVFEELLVDDG